MQTLQDKIILWAMDRHLLDEGHTTAQRYKQSMKTEEELRELQAAIMDGNKAEVADAIGDIAVTLVIQAHYHGLNFIECVEHAYNVIKNRTGRTINGTFIKDK